MSDPLRPHDGSRWGRREAAHLLRRAGFTPDEAALRAAVDQGHALTVDAIMTGARSERFDELDRLAGRLASRNNINELRAWWALRLRHTGHPLAARMTVFWHDHFATSNAKVGNPPMMLDQLRLFERHALGHLEPLLQGVARDPAMIVFLDGNDNVKGRPNENFARELFELFTLGVGAYDEHDIQEAARAFTGWQQKRGRFRFLERAHDHGDKRVFDATVQDGDEVIALAMGRPECATFIAAKLLREFLCPDPPARVVEALSSELRATGFDVGAVLRRLFASETMLDRRWYRARIKSPVEFAVGIARALEMEVAGPALATAISDMGQRLFEPPSVKGWDGHRAWLNSATMLVRMNNASRAASDERFNASSLLARHTHAESPVALAANLTLDGAVPSTLKRRLGDIQGTDEHILREALRLLMTSPEYQMA